jgi:excisionase family DNA binding protein
MGRRLDGRPATRGPLADGPNLTELADQLGEVAQEQARLQAVLLRIVRLLPEARARQETRAQPARELLTVAEVAQFLKVDRATVYVWMYQRGLPFQYVGARRRIPRDALETWMAAQANDNRR